MKVFLLCLVVEILALIAQAFGTLDGVPRRGTVSTDIDFLSSPDTFEFRVLFVRGGQYGDVTVRRLLEVALPHAHLVFTENPSGKIHLIVEGPPNLSDVSPCGPEEVPWAQYIGEPGSMYSNNEWCKHATDPIFRLDTSLKYRSLTPAYTSFIWSPYASIVSGWLLEGIDSLQIQLEEWRRRPYFLAWIASNCDSDTRTSALRQMLEVARKANISDFHSLGACMPNTNITIPPRSAGWPAVVDIYKRYRFVISFENTIEPGYVSEKLVTTLAAGAVPVYYGDGSAARKIFPKAEFIDVHNLLDVEEGIDVLKEPSPADWKFVFNYLVGLDNGKYSMREELRSALFRNSIHRPRIAHRMVSFPSEALGTKTVKEISQKLLLRSQALVDDYHDYHHH